MEVDFLPEELWEGETYILDDGNEDILDFEGERCGICMDAVIDRGVLDCCQHWFCFACIDNWATITSLCPLCQNEFQLITCVPVYDTVGGNKTDEDINRRDDEWFIEGKNNTLSFPSYYIDENAVVCLDEGGCKIRSGSVAVAEDLDIDTSIACDLCDKWYHAFCVGFDPEGTCDNSWLCPRCTVDKVFQKPDGVPMLMQSNQHGLGVAGSGHQFESSFSERVSISVADDGETAIVISLLEGNQRSHESSESVLGCCKDIENAPLSNSLSNIPKSEATLADTSAVELNLGQQEMQLSLSQDSSYSSSHLLSSVQLKINIDEADKRAPRHLSNKLLDSGLDHDLGQSVGSYMSDMKDNDIGHAPRYVEPNGTSEGYHLPVASADKMVSNEMEAISVNSSTPDEKDTIIKITGCKRKHRDSRNGDGAEANSEAKFARKKIKADLNSEPMCLKDQTAEPVLDDIMVIVQGTDYRPRNQIGHKNSSNITSKERESAAGFRVKKIMRRTGDDRDSSLLVQELRKKIREAVRDKSSKEPGKNLFDPKLLDAFRAALAGSGTENMKPTLDVKAKRLLMQKGKVRESLTKKIYGNGGKRRRAWTRECEVEFWKHRCVKTTKPEKIQTLNSVLDQLRDDSGCSETPGTEDETRSSILSRLYLADTSVFPRKNNIKPVSDLKDIATPNQKRESGSIERTPISLPVNQSDKVSAKNNSLLVTVPTLDGKGPNMSIQRLKAETASSDVHQNRLPKGSSSPALGGAKISTKKEMVCKSDITKGDKRKWALEVLARKTAASGKNGMQEKGEDNAILKGNYSLLAQLPKDMRPVLAPSRHNKIPISVRQAQLYRLAEHFLKKVNLSSICRAAETELAIADAINIEKEVADRSSSKLVYVNLCSQELFRRSDNFNLDRAKESNPCSTSEALSNGEAEETNKTSSALEVDKALRNAGLMSDSPPNSPICPIEDLKNGVDSLEKSEDEGPDNIFEVDSHPELDIYGDFEYNLEDDDFIGAGAPKISKLQPEPKIKLVFSSLNLGKPDGTLDPQGNDEVADFGTSKGSSVLLESQNKTSSESPSVDSQIDGCLVQNSSVDGDEEPFHAECEELYGPDKEPLIQKYPDSLSTTPFEQSVNGNLLGDNGDASIHIEKDSGQPSENYVENLKESTSHFEKTENARKEKKSNKDKKKESESNNNVMHKVEAYIKEHLRPLCKSGVITVEQYRWAVGKTTGKVMKYHYKEKNANFLIKEGEKVKKLAEQYVEASQQKAKD